MALRIEYNKPKSVPMDDFGGPQIAPNWEEPSPYASKPQVDTFKEAETPTPPPSLNEPMPEVKEGTPGGFGTFTEYKKGAGSDFLKSVKDHEKLTGLLVRPPEQVQNNTVNLSPTGKNVGHHRSMEADDWDNHPDANAARNLMGIKGRMGQLTDDTISQLKSVAATGRVPGKE